MGPRRGRKAKAEVVEVQLVRFVSGEKVSVENDGVDVSGGQNTKHKDSRGHPPKVSVHSFLNYQWSWMEKTTMTFRSVPWWSR